MIIHNFEIYTNLVRNGFMKSAATCRLFSVWWSGSEKNWQTWYCWAGWWCGWLLSCRLSLEIAWKI